MEYGIWKLGKTDFDGVHAVRKAVFVDEMKIDEDLVFGALDDYSAHLLWLNEKLEPVGTVRMYPAENHSIRLDNLAVIASARGKGTGELMLRMLFDRTQKMGTRDIIAYVPEAYKEYFRKFGFEKIEVYTDSDGGTLTKMLVSNAAVPERTCRCCDHHHDDAHGKGQA